jgi:hypothetical protein
MLRSNAVRRILAIPMLLLFLLPLFSGLFGEGVAQAGIPACCRRDGKHHCEMSAEQSYGERGAGAVREKCPYSPAALSIIVLPSFAPGAAAAIFAGVIQHASVHPQTDARRRISFDRARQKRGPPSLSL